jgi:hypothetical protein
MSTPAATTTAAEPGRLSSAATYVRSETGIALLALSAVGLHIVDDNFLQPEPGI